MMKMTHVYQRNNSWYFWPSSQATTGLWIGTSQVIALHRDDPHYRKGQALRDSLNASMQGVPLPADNEDLAAPLLALAKARSWGEFMKNARCVSIEFGDNAMKIIPHKPLRRPKGALEGMSEKAIVLSTSASDDEIGVALEKVLALSE